MKKFTFELWLHNAGDVRCLSTITVEAKNEDRAREDVYNILTQQVEMELVKEE